MMEESERQLLELARAAFMADRPHAHISSDTTWQLLPDEDRQRYRDIAQAVLNEYQKQANDRDQELKALRQWKKAWMPVVNDWSRRH